MFGNNFKAPILPKIINGLSKTLNIFNEVIPIYKEATPIINNARTTINKIKDFSNKSIKKIIDNKEKNVLPLKEKINTYKSVNLNRTNNPTFFN